MAQGIKGLLAILPLKNGSNRHLNRLIRGNQSFQGKVQGKPIGCGLCGVTLLIQGQGGDGGLLTHPLPIAGKGIDLPIP